MSARKSAWTAERVEILKNRFEAGLTCSEIARDIGVSRNAVLGKLFRLNLSRPKNTAARTAPREPSAKAPRPRFIGQRQILMALRAGLQIEAEDFQVASEHRCSLLELNQEKCRWPVANAGSREFMFCGNPPVKGLPYCAGHARIAYQPGVRTRAVRS